MKKKYKGLIPKATYHLRHDMRTDNYGFNLFITMNMLKIIGINTIWRYADALNKIHPTGGNSKQHSAKNEAC